MKRLFIPLFALSVLNSCSGGIAIKSLFPAQDSSKQDITAATNTKFNEKYKIYEVSATDTIASVARKNNISAGDIIKYNGLKKPYFLRRGDILKIPYSAHEDKDFIQDLDSLEDQNKASERHIQIGPPKTKAPSE